MSWIAEYDTQGREFPTCVHVTKTTGTMTHGATYVPIEDGKAVRAENAKLREENQQIGLVAYELGRKSLAQENAKLRELCKDIYEFVYECQLGCEQYLATFDAERATYDESVCNDCWMERRMRELGVEV